MDMFGWYEVTILAMIVGAFMHGVYSGRKEGVIKGCELTLEHLEKTRIIVVNPDTGEVTPVKA